MAYLRAFSSLKTPQERFDRYHTEFFNPEAQLHVGNILYRAAQLRPDHTALVCKEKTITYQDLYTGACAITTQLKGLGVKKGDIVCLLYENSISYYKAYYAIWQCGAVVAPLNIFLTEKELHHILEECKPTALVTSQELHTKSNLAALTQTTVLIIPGDDQPDNDLKNVQSHDQNDIQTDLDVMVVLLYTSGTTGFPKGVMLSSRNILTNIIQALSSIVIYPNDRLLSVLPLFHSFAQNIAVWCSTFLAITTIIIPKIDRKAILDGFNQQPTVVIGVPALYALLCMVRNLDLSSVRYFVSGGDALPDKIRAFFELIYRRKLCNGYGLTETAPFIAVDLDDELKPTSTIGRPAPGLAISLRDEEGKELSKHEVGILWVKGDNVMLGYFKAPEATAAVLQNGWLNTGDFATYDVQGRLVIMGRFKDLIIHKGFNIYPQEIENVLMGFPGMMQVAVIGVPDDTAGEVPVAYVLLKDPVEDLPTKLKKLCMQQLAAYKIPREFIAVQELPKTALGKVDKKRLKKEYTASKTVL